MTQQSEHAPTSVEAEEAARRIIAKLNVKGLFKFGGIVPATDADMVARAFLSRREEVIEECAKAAEAALLTAGYQWGHDAMEQFNYGKTLAAKAIRSLQEQEKTK